MHHSLKRSLCDDPEAWLVGVWVARDNLYGDDLRVGEAGRAQLLADLEFVACGRRNL